jgi:DNA mismatch repair protein MutS
VARLAGIPAGVIERAQKILFRIENGEHEWGRTAGGPLTFKPAPVQLELFRPAENPIVRRLRGLDINALTPLEAMNLLSLMQELAKAHEHE